MPLEMESRIRRRIQGELFAPPKPARRLLQKPSFAQVFLLVVLLAAAGWVVASQVMPVIQSAWERMCAPVEKR